MTKGLYAQAIRRVRVLTLLIILLRSFAGSEASAEARCQVLDVNRSQTSLNINVLNSGPRRASVSNPKAYLWIDPRFPEEAKLIAEAAPQVSRSFGALQENPLLGGLLSTVLDQPLVFKSTSIAKSLGSKFEVAGRVSVGGRQYPATFPVTGTKLSRESSVLQSTVSADDVGGAIGVPGSVEGSFNLVFRDSALPENRCTL